MKKNYLIKFNIFIFMMNNFVTKKLIFYINVLSIQIFYSKYIPKKVLHNVHSLIIFNL